MAVLGPLIARFIESWARPFIKPRKAPVAGTGASF